MALPDFTICCLWLLTSMLFFHYQRYGYHYVIKIYKCAHYPELIIVINEIIIKAVMYSLLLHSAMPYLIVMIIVHFIMLIITENKRFISPGHQYIQSIN